MGFWYIKHYYTYSVHSKNCGNKKKKWRKIIIIPLSPNKCFALVFTGYHISSRDLEREFRKFGRLMEVWMSKSRQTPTFAFVVFRHLKDAEKALREMDGTWVHFEDKIATGQLHAQWKIRRRKKMGTWKLDSFRFFGSMLENHFLSVNFFILYY